MANLKLSGLRQYALKAAVLVSFLVPATFATQPALAATNQTCGHWGIKTLEFGQPAGVYCFGVNGNAAAVTNTTGSVNTTALSNWNEVVRFYDASGNQYYTYTGPLHPTTTYGAYQWTTPVTGAFHAGQACGTLYSNSSALITECVALH